MHNKSYISSGLFILVGLLTTSIAQAHHLPSESGGLLILFHSHAHDAEISQAGAAMLYGLGFMFAAAALIGLGLGLGRLYHSAQAARLILGGGFALVVTGAMMWIRITPW